MNECPHSATMLANGIEQCGDCGKVRSYTGPDANSTYGEWITIGVIADLREKLYVAERFVKGDKPPTLLDAEFAYDVANRALQFLDQDFDFKFLMRNMDTSRRGMLAIELGIEFQCLHRTLVGLPLIVPSKV